MTTITFKVVHIRYEDENRVIEFWPKNCCCMKSRMVMMQHRILYWNSLTCIISYSNFIANIMNCFLPVCMNIFFAFRVVFSDVVLVDGFPDLTPLLSTNCKPTKPIENRSTTHEHLTICYFQHFMNFSCGFTQFNTFYANTLLFFSSILWNLNAMQTCAYLKID